MLRFGDFELCEESRELRRAGQRLPLQPKVLGLLAFLIRHRARVVPQAGANDAAPASPTSPTAERAHEPKRAAELAQHAARAAATLGLTAFAPRAEALRERLAN